MSLPLQAQVEPNIGCLGVCNVADTVSSGLRYDRQQPLHIRHCRWKLEREQRVDTSLSGQAEAVLRLGKRRITQTHDRS